MTTVVALAAAGGAALALNGSYLVQHAGLASAPPVRGTRPVATIAALLRSRRWLAGALLGYAGLGLEGAATTGVAMSIVQAIVAAGLVVVVLGAARMARRAPSRREALAVALTGGALVALALTAPAGGLHALPSPGALLACALLAGTGVAALVVGPGGRHPVRLALAAGVLYGITTVALAALLRALLHSPSTPTLAAEALGLCAITATGGFFAFQRALQAGSPVVVVTLMTVATNATAIAGGLFALSDPLAAAGVARALQLAALALAAAGALLLVAGGVANAAPGGEEAPDLDGRGEADMRARVGRTGARPRVRSPGDRQVLDAGPPPARPPVEARDARTVGTPTWSGAAAVARGPGPNPVHDVPALGVIRHDGIGGAVDLEDREGVVGPAFGQRGVAARDGGDRCEPA